MPVRRPPRPARLGSTVRRAVLRRRRLLAALTLAIAVVAGLRAVAPPPPPTEAVPLAARDLAAGTRLAAGDLVHRRLPGGAVPAGVLADPAGEVLAAPVRAGEPVTDVRVLGDGLLSAYPGTVAVPLRLPDPDAVALLAAGDLVDLYGGAGDGSGARLLVAGARVVALPPTTGGGPVGAAPGGRLLVLAVPPEAVAAVVDAQVRDYLSFTIAA